MSVLDQFRDAEQRVAQRLKELVARRGRIPRA